MDTYILATTNPMKYREILSIIGETPGIQILSMADFPGAALPEETGATFAENARLKAEYCTNATGLPSIAEDSGVEIAAFDGAPGLYSARWLAGPAADKTAEILRRMEGVPAEKRAVRLCCSMVLVYPNRPDLTVEVEGTWNGVIATSARFGENSRKDCPYDPILEMTSGSYAGMTLDEMPVAEKNAVSHRGKALAQLIPHLLNS